MKQGLQLRLSQQLAMTPQPQQAIRLLQLSTLELQQEIQEALDANPLLEVEDEPTGTLPERLSSDHNGSNSLGDGDDVGGERLAAVGEQRAALAVGAVVEGGSISLGGLGIHAQVHQGVATKVIGLAHNLIGSFCRPKHLGCSGKITRAVSGAALLDQLAIQGSPLYS